MADFFVLLNDQKMEPQAVAISKKLKCPLFTTRPASYSTCLLLESGKIYFQGHIQNKEVRTTVDFLSPQFQYRRRFGLSKNQIFLKAMSLPKLKGGRVLDLTSGWGTDAFFLACAGFRVTSLERSPILSLLLKDGYERALCDKDLETQVLPSLQFKHTNSFHFLENLQDKNRPEIIYLDPMFSPKSNPALPPKELQLLALLVPPMDEEKLKKESLDLLHLARQKAKDRIIIKRPLGGSLLKPHHSYKGKSIQYDLFLPYANQSP